MSYALTLPTQTVGTQEPRTLTPLMRERIAEERGIETPQILMIEAPPAPLLVALREEIVPQPDALWLKLAGQERFPREENRGGEVTWEEFLETMRQFLEHLVNSQFLHMNETYSRVTEQLSVRDAFFSHANEYMMGEMMRLVKRVEELEAPDTPGDPMEICIENVEPILPPQNYQTRLLTGISNQVWTWKTTVPREKSRRDPYGRKGSRRNTPDPHRKRGSRAGTPAPRITSSTTIVAPQAVVAEPSEAPASSLDYSDGSPAYTGDSPDPRPEYMGPSSVVQRLSFAADNLRPDLPRSTSLVNVNQPSQTFAS